MNFKEYQMEAANTVVYKGGTEMRLMYVALGLNGEAGEVAEKIKKFVRDGTFDVHPITLELGDCLWYLAALATELGLDLDDIARANINKLASRNERGVVHGDGDNR